jgi:hypothetical protein
MKMKTTLLTLIFASLALAQATVRVVVTNDAGKVTSDVTVQTNDEQLNLLNDHRLAQIKTPAVAEVRAAPAIVKPAVPAVYEQIPSTDPLAPAGTMVNGKLISEAVPAIYEDVGQIITPAQPAVLTYPTRAAWWRMLVANNIRSIAGDKTKAVLAKKQAAEAAQAALQAEMEKVAQ